MRTTRLAARGVLLLCAIAASSAFAFPCPMSNTRYSDSSSSVSLIPMKSSQNGGGDNRNIHSRNAIPGFQFVAAGMIAASALLGPIHLGNEHAGVPVASAVESRIIGELKGSGLFFKDTLVIESFEDPKVKGVTLYISNFQRPLTERLQKDFFSDPSSAAVGCAKTGPVQIADNIAKGKEGEEVFKESKSLLFKSLRVQRLYDEQSKAIVYVSYSTRLDKNDDSNNSRFKSSLCAISLDEGGAPMVASAQAAATVGAATP